MSHHYLKRAINLFFDCSTTLVTRFAEGQKKMILNLPRLAFFISAMMHLQGILVIPAIAASKAIPLHNAKPLLLPARVA